MLSAGIGMYAFITWMWLGGIALQTALAAVIVARKVWVRFPFFAAYMLTNLAFNGLLYLINFPHASARVEIYFYCYWISQAITLMLGLATVFEIFASLLVSHPRLRKQAMLVCRYALPALGLFGVLVIIFHPAGDTTRNSPFFALETAVRIGEVGLVVLLFVFAGIFGLPWRQSAFGIAIGIGLYASVRLIAVAFQSYAGQRAWNLPTVADMLAFDLSLFIWMGSLLLPEYTPPERFTGYN